jgi:hypothetical protein
MHPTTISASIARRGVTIFLLLFVLASALALGGCDALPDTDSENGNPAADVAADGNGEQRTVELARQESGGDDGEGWPRDLPLELKFQWVGQIVVSEIHGIQLGTECGSWLLTFDSPEVESRAANSAGMDVIVWGYVTGLDDANVVQSVPEQSIKVESVFTADDPMPSIYIPEYPCPGTIPPDYPVPGPIQIDLLPGEIAAIGKLVKTDDGSVYLETESGRIRLRIAEPVPPVGCEEPGQEARDLPLVPEDTAADCVEVEPAYPVDPTMPEEMPQDDEVLPEPDSGGSGGGVDGYAGSGGTVSGGPAPSTVDSAPSQVAEGETIVVGTWSMEDGQLVIDVRYILDRAYVYPRPIPPPEPGPMPTPIDGGDAGYLSGRVAIGPLCPVEPCTEPAPDVYSRHVLVLESENGEQIEVPLHDGGYFRTALKPGTYVVTLSNCEYMGCSAALPVKVEISAGAVSELVIDIDTGIR